jgi:hypothetical protein
MSDARDDWRSGFDDASAWQAERMLAATPAERLAWLEAAIRLAHEVGALPRAEPEGE